MNKKQKIIFGLMCLVLFATFVQAAIQSGGKLDVSLISQEPDPANPGEIISYWINYSNVGTDWAYNVWMNDTLPTGVTFVSAVPAETSSAGQVYSWFIGNLAPGACLDRTTSHAVP